ncbi:hypothetical protein D3C78_1483610 [compost metagenome]
MFNRTAFNAPDYGQDIGWQHTDKGNPHSGAGLRIDWIKRTAERRLYHRRRHQVLPQWARNPEHQCR